MLSPDNDPIPSDTSDPIPAASSPGASRSRSLAPPIAVASIRITAAISGEEKMNDIAAKLPAAVTSISACGGVSRRARLIIAPATPAPNTISGASGPSTSPNPIVARPARATPGTMSGPDGPPVDRPFAGMCPPSPGSRVIATATISAPTARTGSGHHFGGPF